MNDLELSNLSHTWLIDIDGTILHHNGYLESNDRLLPGVLDFFSNIPDQDFIILLSARPNSEKINTLNFLTEQGIRFNLAIFGVPVGERILINDKKPSGLKTAIAINLNRDEGLSDQKINLITSI